MYLHNKLLLFIYCVPINWRPMTTVNRATETIHTVDVLESIAPLPSPLASWTGSLGCLHWYDSTHRLLTVSRTSGCLQKQPGTQFIVQIRFAPWPWKRVSHVSGQALPHDIYSSPGPHTWSGAPSSKNWFYCKWNDFIIKVTYIAIDECTHRAQAQ